MHLAHYLHLLYGAQERLSDAYRSAADGHVDEVEVYYTCRKLSRQADAQARTLLPYLDQYRRQGPPEPQPNPTAVFHGPRGPGLGLLRDLQELYLMVAECDICWLMVDDAVQGARDAPLLADVRQCHAEAQTQQAWLRTQLAQASVQALVVA